MKRRCTPIGVAVASSGYGGWGGRSIRYVGAALSWSAVELRQAMPRLVHDRAVCSAFGPTQTS